MPGIRSSAATKCISDVPGLAKHVSTPLASKVWTRLSAPFIVSGFGAVADMISPLRHRFAVAGRLRAAPDQRKPRRRRSAGMAAMPVASIASDPGSGTGISV